MPLDSAFQNDPDQLEPPLFKGKTPVLGAPVEIQTSGALPGEFPAAAGPGPGAGPQAPNAPTPPAGFSLKGLDLSFPEFSFDAAPPTPPAGLQTSGGPGVQPTPWWAAAMELGQRGIKTGQDVAKLQAGTPGARVSDWLAPSDSSAFSLTGQAGTDWWNSGTPFSVDPSISGNAADAVLNPADFKILPSTSLNTGLDDPAAIDWSALGSNLGRAAQIGIPAAGTGLGIWGAINAQPGSPQQVLSTWGAGASAAELASQLGVEALGSVAPAMGLVALPMMAGQMFQHFFGRDVARFPEGWTYIPGTGGTHGGRGALGIDPATGRMMEYLGNGRYGWAEQTRNYQLPTPDQLRDWGIEPTGQLATMSGYEHIAHDIMQADVNKAAQGAGTTPGAQAPGAEGTASGPDVGGVPSIPSPAHQQTSLEEFRQPYIDQLRAQNPNADEAEIWRLYTLTPWYQQELAMQAGWQPYGIGERG